VVEENLSPEGQEVKERRERGSTTPFKDILTMT
jgi:hypothetical protein